jgi:formylglycine-generating enzyme required for sulfatase activity
MKKIVCILCVLLHAVSSAQSLGQQSVIHGLLWDLHEVSIDQVHRFAKATGFVSQAEREGGGYVYESGWIQKKGWTWRQPFGVPAKNDEPAVHLTFDEAQAVCQFFNKRLPTDAEWVRAAYYEQRISPPAEFIRGRHYTYPNGDSALESHCLQGCMNHSGVAPQGALHRGTGHIPVLQSKPGVNGLYNMGGNVWEWVNTAVGTERITRGGSWWYDASRQLEKDVATKPPETRVAYIGFRCVR